MITPGTLLQNRYLVHEQVGQGGMGTVYRATDERFGSIVALKETCFTDPNLRRAFEREAALLNRLRHAALPRVSDHFDEGERQFLVMEFVEGCDLAERLETQGEAFPVANVLAWADELLDALEYLHAQEPAVIHRDIKPQNLKLNARGSVVLLDFGLAKNTPAHLSRVTVTGSVFGYSRNYAPLEQMHGTGTDPRSDLYALGATLYHLVTGVVPPDAITRATAVLNSQADPLPPADEMHAQVTPALADWLSVAMRQNAAGRFPSAAEMRRALTEVVSGAYVVAPRNVNQHAGQHHAYSPSFFEQDTKLFGSPAQTAGMSEAAATHGEASGDTTMVRRDDALDNCASTSPLEATRARDAYATQLMDAAPATTKRAGGKRRLAYAAAAIVLLAVTASAFALFIGGAEPATHPAEARQASASAVVESEPPAVAANNADAQDAATVASPGDTPRVATNRVAATPQRKPSPRAKDNSSPAPQRRHASDTPLDLAGAHLWANDIKKKVFINAKDLDGVLLPDGTLATEELRAFVVKKKHEGEEAERRALKREHDKRFQQFESRWGLNQRRGNQAPTVIPAPPVPAQPARSFSPRRHTSVDSQRSDASDGQGDGGASVSSSRTAPPSSPSDSSPLSPANTSAGTRAAAACDGVLY